MKVVVNAYGVLPDEFYFGEEGIELTLCVRTVISTNSDQTSLHQADQESGEVFTGIIHQILSQKEITKTQ